MLYGTEGNPRNVVEGNAMWNCGDSGIQAAADAVIRNNLIVDCPDNGFNSQDHQGVTPANLEFVHNTGRGRDAGYRAPLPRPNRLPFSHLTQLHTKMTDTVRSC